MRCKDVQPCAGHMRSKAFEADTDNDMQRIDGCACAAKPMMKKAAIICMALSHKSLTYMKPASCPGRAWVQDRDQPLEVIRGALQHSVAITNHALADAVLTAIVQELHRQIRPVFCTAFDAMTSH